MSKQKTHPMTSRIMDMTAANSMMASIFGPRNIQGKDLRALTTDLFLLEGMLTHMSIIGTELKYTQHATTFRKEGEATVQVQNHVHTFLVNTPGKHLTVGPFQFSNVSVVSTIGEKSSQGDLSKSFPLSIVKTDFENPENSHEIIITNVNSLELTNAFSKLPLAIFNGLGSLLREVGATVYKGDVDLSQVTSIERASLMRLQDDRLKLACERSFNIVTSDGVGTCHGQNAIRGAQLANDWSMKFLDQISPVVYDWVFKGKAVGTKTYDLSDTAG